MLPAWVNRETVAIAGLGLCTVVFFAYIAWAARRDPLVRWTDILTGDNGRIASAKALQVMAFGLTGWGMVYLTITASATATEWTLFGGAWGGLALGAKFAPPPKAPPPMPQADDKPPP